MLNIELGDGLVVIGNRVGSLLEIDLEKLLLSIENRCGIKLPRKVIEAYLDVEHDMLFIRYNIVKVILNELRLVE
jgi:hypothetical protein